MLHTFLMVIHFFCAAGIVALVLLQRGKGAEAGAGFGAGASGTVFGARGATTALSRATAILAAIFMVTSLSLAYVGTRKSAAPAGGVLDQFAPPSAPAGDSQGSAGTAPAQSPASTGAAPAGPTGAPAAPTGAQSNGAPGPAPK